MMILNTSVIKQAKSRILCSEAYFSSWPTSCRHRPHLTPQPTQAALQVIDQRVHHAAQGNIKALASGNVELQGTILKGLGTDSRLHIEAGYGDKAHADAQLIFRHIKKRVEEEQRRESNSVVWQKIEGSGSNTETLALPKFTGPVKPQLIAPSYSIDVGKNPDGLEAEIDKLLKDSAYDYLSDLLIRDDVKWNEIELEMDSWEYEQEGLTPAGAALVALAVAVASGGAGAGVGATLGGNMGAAAMTALKSQAAITLINNKGNIGKTLKDLESSDTIKQMATAALTAGLLDFVNVKLTGTRFALPADPTGYIQNMYVSTVNSIGSSLVSTAVNGGSLSENLEAALISGAVSGFHAGLAGDIKGLESSYVLHKIMHAAAGCAVAAAQRQACEAGAIGAAVGEMVAGSMMGDRTVGQLTEQEKQQILEVSKLVAGTVAAYTGHDVNTAANVAQTAVQNNALSEHFPRKTVGQNQFMLTNEETVAVINKVYPNGVDLDQVKRNSDYVTFANELVAHVAGPSKLINGLIGAVMPSKGRLPPASVMLRRVGTDEVKDLLRPATPFEVFRSTAGPVTINPIKGQTHFMDQAGQLGLGGK